jgi:parvulin-like peptidyl-prolyl isomerase
VRQRRREKAELALAAIAESRDDSTADFGAAAVRYSEDQATRYRGGDTGWILRGTPARFDPELVEAIFALAQPGDDTGLLVLPKGFAVAKLLERAPAEQRSLAEVRTRLERRLLSRKRSFAHDEFLAEMRAAVHVEIDEQWLGGAESPLPLVAHAMSPGRME